MKHKHCDLIKAWADGAEIEININSSGHWLATSWPSWDPDYGYRIKPSPRTFWVNVYPEISCLHTTEESAAKNRLGGRCEVIKLIEVIE